MRPAPIPPSGDQFTIEAGGYRAVVTECGGGLRELSFDGRPLIDGFAEDVMAGGGRGQLLMPWPNRIRDGRYTFEGTEYQLPLSEPKRNNASHGLVRWAAWTLEEHTGHSVSLQYRLMAQSGYPWTVDLHVLYDVSANGLTVTQTATNLSPGNAPYAAGAHPYLKVADGSIDTWELTLPAATRSLTDDRLLPVGSEPVDGTDYDFRVSRPLRETGLDDGFTDLEFDDEGYATATLRDPASGFGVDLWADQYHRWFQVYSADDAATAPRTSLAIEPMTAGADAFRSGQDLLVLRPAGQPGDEVSASWGIRVAD